MVTSHGNFKTNYVSFQMIFSQPRQLNPGVINHPPNLRAAASPLGPPVVAVEHCAHLRLSPSLPRASSARASERRAVCLPQSTASFPLPPPAGSGWFVDAAASCLLVPSYKVGHPMRVTL